MTETQSMVWVIYSLVCAEVNNAFQELTHSRQSKKLTVSIAFLNDWTTFKTGEN